MKQCKIQKVHKKQQIPNQQVPTNIHKYKQITTNTKSTKINRYQQIEFKIHQGQQMSTKTNNPKQNTQIATKTYKY